MANVGTATLDFGAGGVRASVDVTGQTGIAAGAKAEAFFMADDFTADHTAFMHQIAPTVVALTCGNIVAGTGFTIYATSRVTLRGQLKVNWVWSA